MSSACSVILLILFDHQIFGKL